MIETFTKSDFETALQKAVINPNSIQCLGFIYGELCYFIQLDNRCGIYIRSSIRQNGYNAETGEDSIRFYLSEKTQNGFSFFGKIAGKYIQRVSGWDRRLSNVIFTMTESFKISGYCHNNPMVILKVKKDGINRGRLFAKCNCCNNFKWITE